MAIGFLQIFILVLLVMSILGIFLLFTNKNKMVKNILFYFLVILTMFITYINISSLPMNYLVQKIIALVPLVIAIIAMVIKIKKSEKMSIANIIITISVIIADLILLGALSFF